MLFSMSQAGTPWQAAERWLVLMSALQIKSLCTQGDMAGRTPDGPQFVVHLTLMPPAFLLSRRTTCLLYPITWEQTGRAIMARKLSRLGV